MTADLAPDCQVFNIPEAAAYLRCGPRIVRRLVQQKKIAFVRIDERGTVRIHRAALDRYLQGGGK